MIREVKFCNREKLSCSYAADKSVILCLADPSLVVSETCNYPFTTITGTICQAYPSACTGDAPIWNYTIQYDDSQLVDPSSALAPGDIVSVFCVTCMVQYFQQQLGAEMYIQTNPDNSQAFVSQHGCVFPLLGLSPSTSGCTFQADTFGGTTQDAILAALATIGSAPATLIIGCGNWSIPTSVTIPSNIFLSVVAGAVLSIGGLATFRISGSFEAPGVQVFSGAGHVLFDNYTIFEIDTRWFGTGDAAIAAAGLAAPWRAVTGIIATGTLISDAATLFGLNDTVTSVPVANNGVKLWDAPIGTSITVANNDAANDMLVYPDSAFNSIGLSGPGVGVTVAHGTASVFWRETVLQWRGYVAGALY